jgi:polyhydroxybutyrate depolymerase
MSYRMACEASGRFAAFAPVASSLVLDACDPARAVPLLHIHGLKDPNVPFEGGAGCGPGTLEQSQPVEEVVATWSARHGCVASQTTTLDREDVTCVVSDGCEERVQLCTLPRGGHVWPGGPEGSAVSSPSCPEDKGYVASFDASQTIMDFVLSHALEQLPE